MMNQYKLEDCSVYHIYDLSGTPVIVFNNHNMALPVWGTFSHRNSCKYNLITFDSHTDTHPAFNAYVLESGNDPEFGVDVLKTPAIKNY